MLAQAEQADVIMAPAADMFEMGVKVQVLKRGTMFAMRAAKLYELYRAHARLEDLPAAERAALEKNLFRAPLEEIWAQTRVYFMERDPRQVERAEREPKHRMALVFRWYLGQSSRWANVGEPTRKLDYQVWCGPAMGAFNEWTKGSFLEHARNRRVVPVAYNLLYGAAVLLRLSMLRCQGVPLDPEWSRLTPVEPDRLDAATR
jgi:PfaD family protein